MTRIILKPILMLSLIWTVQGQQAVKTDGCVACHGQIEPMHRYGPTETLEKVKDGKDAVGLSCTACHGGNPVSRVKDEAHVRPQFPREWRRSGANPERSNTLLARESWEFVRFVIRATCGL